MVKNQGDCWQWKANGQCVKGDNCSFRHDMNKRGKSSPSNPVKRRAEKEIRNINFEGTRRSRIRRTEQRELGLLKSGMLTNRWTIERGNPLKLLGERHTSPNKVSLMRRPSTFFWKKKKKKLMVQRCTRCQPSKKSNATAVHHWRSEAELELSLGS